MPTPAPDSAVKLLDTLAKYCAAADGKNVVADAGPTPADPAARLDLVRKELSQSASQLSLVLDDNWRRYLALPAEIFEAGKAPAPEVLAASIERFEAIARDPQYRKLHDRLEFRATLDLLREYSATLSESARGTISLPPPPAAVPNPFMR